MRDFRSIQHAWADGKILSSKKKKYIVCSGHTTMEGAWSLCCRGLTLTTRALARLPRIKVVLAETFFLNTNFTTHFFNYFIVYRLKFRLIFMSGGQIERVNHITDLILFFA